MIGETKQLTILILLAVVASGCADGTSNDTTSTTGPISVNTFDAIPNPASSNRNVNINIELENTGDSDANRVAARIFGPTFSQPDNSDSDAWRGSDGDALSAEDRTVYFSRLRAPSENVPSVPRSRSISLSAPDIDPGREIESTWRAKIFYSYETTGSTDFKLVSYNRYQNENLERTSAVIDSSAAPIQLDIRGTTPKIFYPEENDGTVDSEVCVRVTNEGSGTAFLGGTEDIPAGTGSQVYTQNSDAGYDKNKVRVSIDDIANVDFEARNGGGNSAEVTLIEGNEGFQCFTMTAESLAGLEEQNVNTQIKAEYNYVKEAETTVTVEGRRGGSSSNNDDDSDGDATEAEYDWTGSDSALSSQTTVVSNSEDIEDPSVAQVCEWLQDNNEESYNNNCEEQ